MLPTPMRSRSYSDDYLINATTVELPYNSYMPLTGSHSSSSRSPESTTSAGSNLLMAEGPQHASGASALFAHPSTQYLSANSHPPQGVNMNVAGYRTPSSNFYASSERSYTSPSQPSLSLSTLPLNAITLIPEAYPTLSHSGSYMDAVAPTPSNSQTVQPTDQPYHSAFGNNQNFSGQEVTIPSSMTYTNIPGSYNYQEPMPSRLNQTSNRGYINPNHPCTRNTVRVPSMVPGLESYTINTAPNSTPGSGWDHTRPTHPTYPRNSDSPFDPYTEMNAADPKHWRNS
ncbi:hypothetical protein C0991_006534 [Blastosporella zonata]|nr:hypothetical protein C0991_006534 [Blastosporella zonata]